MKRWIIFLVFVLLNSLAFSQIYIKPNNTYGVTYNRVKPDSTQHIPTFCGAPSGIESLHSNYTRMAALYYDSCGSKLYVFNPSDSLWSEVGSGSGSSLDSIRIFTGSGDSVYIASYTGGVGDTSFAFRNIYLQPDNFTIFFEDGEIGANRNTAIWNADKLYNTPIISTAPAIGQTLAYDGTYYRPTDITVSAGYGITGNGTPGDPVKVDTVSADGVATKFYTQTAQHNAELYADSVTSRQYPIQQYNNLLSFGDSYTAGDGASPSGRRYTTTINDALTTTELNYGVGGAGLYTATSQAFQNEAAQEKLAPMTLMVGFNDIRKHGATDSCYYKILDGHKAIFANHFLKSAIPANSGSVSTTGTWSTMSTGLMYQKAQTLSGLARSSSVSGSTLSYTFNGNFLVIGCFGSDGVAADDGSFTVTIDGTVVDTWVPNGRCPTTSTSYDGVKPRSYAALVYDGLGAGSHTVVITTLENKATYIDYFGLLQQGNEAIPVFVGGATKLKAAGYAYYSFPVIGDASMDSCSAAVKEAIRAFPGFPIAFVDPNKYIDTANDFYVDNIHPDNSGHAAIGRAFREHMLINGRIDRITAKQYSSTGLGLFRAENDAAANAQVIVGGSAYGSGSGFIRNGTGLFSTSAGDALLGAQSSAKRAGLFVGGLDSSNIKFWVLNSGNGYLQSSSATGLILHSWNTNSATDANVRAQNDASNYVQISTMGSTQTTGALYGSNTAVLRSNVPLYIGSNTAGLGFYTGGNAAGNERMHITTGGQLIVNGTTSPGPGIYFNRSFGMQKDSLPTVSSTTGLFATLYDSTDSKFKKILVSSLPGGGGGGITGVGTFDSQSPAANGLVISGSDIFAQSATASVPGMVNTSTQTFAGAKTWNNLLAYGSDLSGSYTDRSLIDFGSTKQLISDSLSVADTIYMINVGDGDTLMKNYGDSVVFKSLKAGTNAVLTPTDSTIIISFQQSFVDSTTTAYTLSAADNGKILRLSNASAITLTVPTGLGTNFTCTVMQMGSGKITFTASGTTITNVDSYTTTRGAYAVATIVSYASNSFVTTGAME